MRVSQAIAVHSAARSLIALLTGLAFFACFGAAESLAADSVRQPTAIQFSFDRPIDASAAPFVLAAADGLFGSEGLAVTTHIANGSPDAIARVAAVFVAGWTMPLLIISACLWIAAFGGFALFYGPMLLLLRDTP